MSVAVDAEESVTGAVIGCNAVAGLIQLVSSSGFVASGRDSVGLASVVFSPGSTTKPFVVEAAEIDFD